MREVGIELDSSPGRLLTQEMAEHADLVIGMGCAVEEACPALTVPLEDWALDDPKGKSPEEVAAIRDEVSSRVEELVARLDAERV